LKLSSFKWIYAAALLIVVTLIYFPGLSGDFFFDDNASIVNNPALKLFDGSFASLIAASSEGVASPLGRPLSLASFALNLHFLGATPFYFKLVNLLIHLATGGLVFALVCQLWPRLAGGGSSFPAAWWVTAVWLLHPINLAPVLFVVQRMTSLAAFFTLAALCLYVYGRQRAGIRGWVAIAISLLALWPLGILAKETALLLPLFIVICESLVLGGFRSVPARILWSTAIILGLAVTWGLVANWSLIASGYEFRDFGPVERLLTEARVLWFYLLQLFIPWPDYFSLYHDDFQISADLLSPPQTLLAVGGWVVVTALAFHLRKRMPLFAFAVAWFLAAHALESTLLPLEIAYEHRNYLASLGVFLWLASLLFSAPRQESGRIPKLVLAACFLMFATLVTALRANQWGDEYRRTQLEAMIHPNSARASYEAGVALMERALLDAQGGNSVAYQMTVFYFKRAAALDRSGKAALVGQLYLDCLANVPKNADLRQTLRERFATTPFRPGDRGLVHSLSTLLVENRLCLDGPEVHALLDAALSNPAANGSIRGMIYAVAMDYAVGSLKSLPLALDYARAAAESDPGSAPLRINLIRLLLASGNETEARQQYQALGQLHIAPNDRSDFEQIGVDLRLTEQARNLP
jgi:protein O-mannosyl-transferase